MVTILNPSKLVHLQVVAQGSHSLYLVNSSLNQFAQITSPEGSFDIYDLRELPHDPVNKYIHIYI